MTTAVTSEVRDHAAIAHQYADDVVAGRVLACRWVRLACQRHLDDLARQETEAFPYRFDPDAGGRVCRFAELLPHTKGKWSVARPGQPRSTRIRLEPWQVFQLVVLFGWVITATGLRRFRRAYLEIPRKNGKSVLAAVIGLYMTCADGEPGAEVYSGATTEKQAWEVFRPARLMALKTPEVQDTLGVRIAANSLYREDDGSKFEPLIGNPGDGASPSCAIVDEYHEHDTDAQYDTMVTGMGAREQPLALVITTAGEDLEGPCFAMHEDVQRMLDGSAPDEELYGIIYTIDEADAWSSDLALRKANPNYGVSVFPGFLQSQIAQGLRSPRKQNVVKTKHLNVWCAARNPWMNLEAWAACADAPPEEEFAGARCWLGLDLSSKLDLTSKVRLVARLVDGVVHYYAYARHWLPEAQIEDEAKRHYQGWARDGWLVATEGNVIDYDTIQADVLEDGQRFEIAAVGHDPWGATQLIQSLQRAGLPCVEVPQTVVHLSEPMKELEALVVARRFHHRGDPVLTWCVANVTVKPDAKDNIYPRKQRPEGKIDGAVAAIIALGRALDDGDDGSVYDSGERPDGLLAL